MEISADHPVPEINSPPAPVKWNGEDEEILVRYDGDIEPAVTP